MAVQTCNPVARLDGAAAQLRSASSASGSHRPAVLGLPKQPLAHLHHGCDVLVAANAQDAHNVGGLQPAGAEKEQPNGSGEHPLVHHYLPGRLVSASQERRNLSVMRGVKLRQIKPWEKRHNNGDWHAHREVGYRVVGLVLLHAVVQDVGVVPASVHHRHSSSLS